MPMQKILEVSRSLGIALEARGATNSWVHDVERIGRLPSVLHVLRRRVLGAVAMFGRQLPSDVVDGVLDLETAHLYVHILKEGQIFVEDVAAEMRVHPPIFDRVLFLGQRWVVRVVL